MLLGGGCVYNHTLNGTLSIGEIMARTRSTGQKYAAELLEEIKAIRVEHSACTARELSRRMMTSHTLIVRQLDNMSKAGLVTWTPMTGSLKVTPAGGKFIAAVNAGKTVELNKSRSVEVVENGGGGVPLADADGAVAVGGEVA
jgi:hypothetical protein